MHFVIEYCVFHLISLCLIDDIESMPSTSCEAIVYRLYLSAVIHSAMRVIVEHSSYRSYECHRDTNEVSLMYLELMCYNHRS